MCKAKSFSFPSVAETKGIIRAPQGEYWNWLAGKFSDGTELSLIQHDSVYTMAERFFRRFALAQDPGHKPFIFSFFGLDIPFLEQV